jgi:threonine/homoserine/homoserine lactone efflux protein
MFLAAVLGFLFGFVGSMPVAGPIAVLVLVRGLDNRFRSGLFIALGGAIAEGAYAFLAFWGLGALMERHTWIDPATRVAGAVICLVLGIIFLRADRSPPPTTDPAHPPRSSNIGSALLGFGITASNPTLIATWTAAVAILFGSSLITPDRTTSIVFASFATIGILAWFSVMLAVIYRMRERFKPSTLSVVRRATGALLLGFSAWFVFRAISYFG